MTSAANRWKQPALLAEDGATFHAHVEPIPGGPFQVSCHAQIDHRSRVEIEAPEYQLCASKTEARAWVHQQAAARGFGKILWDDEASMQPD
jgi:hypothetical protein